MAPRLDGKLGKEGISCQIHSDSKRGRLPKGGCSDSLGTGGKHGLDVDHGRAATAEVASEADRGCCLTEEGFECRNRWKSGGAWEGSGSKADGPHLFFPRRKELDKAEIGCRCGAGKGGGGDEIKA